VGSGQINNLHPKNSLFTDFSGLNNEYRIEITPLEY
jgi:hypothetical protein